MCTLDNFHHIQQEDENDCWIACALMIANYKRYPRSKVSFDELMEKKEGIDGQAVELLARLLNYKWRYKDLLVVDDHAIPTTEEIKDAIRDKT